MEIRTELGKEPIAVISLNQQRSWNEFTGKVNAQVSGSKALYFTYSGEGYVDFISFTLK